MTGNRSKRFSFFFAVTFFFYGVLFFSPAATFRSGEVAVPSAHAGFFSQELETMEEVVELVSGKYVYPPNYKKLFSAAISQMMVSAGEQEFTITDIPEGQRIKRDSSQVKYTLNYDKNHNWESFRKVYYFLLEGNWGKYTKEDLETAAVIGLMNSLDLYSQYLDKSAFDKSMRDTEGKYGGLGMVVTMKDDALMVVKTMKRAPAERAGILSGDIFRKVNGQGVKEMDIQGLADALRGRPNTQVTVTLERPGVFQAKDFSLTREIISVQTVEYKTLDDRIGYVQISSFSKQTDDQLNEGLTQAKLDGVQAFILDLRSNPGGLLNQSVKVASHFLHEGRLVVFTQGRAKEDTNRYHSLLHDNLLHMPVVILVNLHSASAAEIVAGALRDSGKALIIGENSYGKGSVQTIFRITDGSGLRLTTSKYFTPSGTDISEHCIVPDIKIVKDKSYLIANQSKAAAGKNAGPKAGPFIELVEPRLAKFLEGKGWKPDDNQDASLEFAHMLLKNMTVANKKKTLEKARELAANILY